jgi:hypothetical protein
MNRNSMNPNHFFLTLLAALTFAFSGSPGYAQDEKADKKTVSAAPGAIAPTKGDLRCMSGSRAANV